MNFYATSALINAITSIILGAIALSRNKKDNTNVVFSLMSLAIFIWSLFYFLWQMTDNYNSALFYVRMLSIGSALIPIFYLHWVLSFLGQLNNKRQIIILYFGYIATFIFLLFSFSNYFIKDLEPILIFKFWPKAGFLYTLHLLICYVFLIGYGFEQLVKNYFKSVGIKRDQIKYIILGTIVGFFGGSTNFFLWYDIPILPLGNIIVSLYVFTLFYAIVRYRLMDIRIVARRIFIYFGIAVFVYVFFYSLIWFYNKTFGSVFSASAYATGILLAPIFAVMFYGVDRALRIIANKYLFASLYNYQKTIDKLAEDLNNYIDLDKIVNLIVDTIKDTMKLDRAGVLLSSPEDPTHYQIVRTIGFNEQNGISLVHDNFLTEFILKSQKPLVRDELEIIAKNSQSEKARQNLKRLYRLMEHIEASICLPLVSGKKLIGIIVLGSKISGDAYTKEDLDLLNTLSKQAGIALENARLYKQVQDFNKTLKTKIDEQTKEIKEAYQVEKKAREELEKLDIAKTQFMMATQHHLRTPLTSIRGYVDLLLSGTYGKISPKIKDPIEKIQISSNRLIRVVNEFLDVSQFQLGKDVVSLTPGVDIDPIIKEIEEELKFEAKTKNIYLKIEKEKNLPKITADSEKLKMALFNFIDNGIKYTTKGGVTVGIKAIKGKMEISVKDTGLGISAKDKETIFSRVFERGVSAKKIHGTGRGIGLYIAGHIVLAHHGKVRVESKIGEGSTFFIEIPLSHET